MNFINFFLPDGKYRETKKIKINDLEILLNKTKKVETSLNLSSKDIKNSIQKTKTHLNLTRKRDKYKKSI